jgi:D-lactate dehydrogenase
MKVAVFSTKSYDRRFLEAANLAHGHELSFLEPRLTTMTASLAAGYRAVCVFINDQLDAGTMKAIAAQGIQLVALRSAGFNHVDLNAAAALGLTVVRVPEYSPYAVAEHTVALILALNRKICRAHNRVRDDNFSLEGLMGFDLHGSTVGIIGTGKIGQCFAQIMQGFGCRLLAYDVRPNAHCESLGVEYVALSALLSQSDIVSLHCPLTPQTHHLLNTESLCLLKEGAMLINTSRGGLLDTPAVIESIKSGKIGYLGIDVYEQEEALFFEDLSDAVIQDDTFQLLQSFPNVMITAHQAFFTRNALANIADTTLANITDFEQGKDCPNQVRLEKVSRLQT